VVRLLHKQHALSAARCRQESSRGGHAPECSAAAGLNVLRRHWNIPQRFERHKYLALGWQYTRLKRDRTMATRTCASGHRTFEITLSGTPAESASLWTVEHVYDKSLNEEIQVPGMDSIVASTEDAAFARTCDHIDKWLRSKT
jgi:hypothetical protein